MFRPSSSARVWTLAILLLLAVLAAYANHFQNGFHFDDGNTILDNSAVTSLANVPHFFTDARTFSALPTHHVYRPLTTASLALDYWLARRWSGNGLQPFAYHLSTFFWFLVQLACMYALYLTLFDRAVIPALFAVAFYALHPVSAETVNYIVQRADLYATLGVVAALVVYIWYPHHRRFGLYLLPALLGLLAKPSALVFAPILLAYVLLFERRPGQPLLRSGRAALPAFLLCGMYWIFQAAMTPHTYVGSSFVRFEYWLTQPYVTLRYFVAFFLPIHLSADTDLQPFKSLWTFPALLGFLFTAALVAVAFVTARHREWRPVSFGLWWFLIGLVPTAVTVLAETENDHRMFLPFVGLSAAVSWTATRLAWRFQIPSPALASIAVLTLAALAYGTHLRNQVWHSDESLWRDVVQKSPRNGRGLMNYGIALMQKGEIGAAYNYFTRAAAFTPNYSNLEINLGVGAGALGRDAEAARHFERALVLGPDEAQSYTFYARWLAERGRTPEATALLARASARNLVPHPPNVVESAVRQAAAQPTPENYLNLSLAYYQTGRFDDCITAARQALRLRPDYAEAYTNIAAAYQTMGRWDQAIEASQQALRLKPDYQLARNNLAWELQQRTAHNRN